MTLAAAVTPSGFVREPDGRFDASPPAERLVERVRAEMRLGHAARG